MKQKYIKRLSLSCLLLLLLLRYRIESYIGLVFHIGNEKVSKTNSMYKYINMKDEKFIHII